MAVEVILEFNCATEGSPSWSIVTTGDELTWTTSALTTGYAYADVPYITKPTSGATFVERLWIWDTSVSEFSQVTTYDGTANANINVLRWSWNAALNSGPIFTSYYDGTHATSAKGNNSVLGGTNSTDSYSHLKAVMSLSGLGSGWCTETSGSFGSVTTTNEGQSLNGDTGGDAQYLQRTWDYGSADNQTLNVIMYVSAEESTGEYKPYFSCKYTYV